MTTDASASALRDAVAIELLEEATSGRLDIRGPLSTVSRFYDARGLPSHARRLVRQQVIEQYLDREKGIRRDGYAAIVTAGPPGAGKTTSMRASGVAGPGWRTLDADIVKDLLLTLDLPTRFFQELLNNRVLADGHRMHPREFASLVHLESVGILDEIRTRCLADGENVIIEGTLSWLPYSREILLALALQDYQSVTIYDVEVPEATAQERAVNRWWTGRLAAIAGTDLMGGRFTPRAAIAERYSGAVRSICSAVAQAAFDSRLGREFRELVLICDGQTTEQLIRTEQRREHGELVVADPSFETGLTEPAISHDGT